MNRKESQEHTTNPANMDFLNFASNWVILNPTSFTVLAITFFIVVTLVISVIRSYNRLGSIPGPWLAKYTRLWLLQALRSEECAQRYLKASETYGTSFKAF